MASREINIGSISVLVPAAAAFAVINGRHSKSIQNGPNETRTLTTDGVDLAHKVRPAYQKLITELQAMLPGKTVYASSTWPRSLITTFSITRAEQIVQLKELCADASVKKAPAPAGSPHPNLYAHFEAEGLNVGGMLQRIAADISLMGDQPVATALESQSRLVHGDFASEATVTVSFNHEPAISLFAAQTELVKSTDLGLEETDSFVFFLDFDRRIIEIQKFTPAKLLTA